MILANGWHNEVCYLIDRVDISSKGFSNDSLVMSNYNVLFWTNKEIKETANNQNRSGKTHFPFYTTMKLYCGNRSKTLIKMLVFVIILLPTWHNNVQKNKYVILVHFFRH